MTDTTSPITLDQLRFFVPGPPVPFTRVLKGSKQPRAERYRAYRLAVGLTAMQAGAEIIDGSVDVSIAIFDDQKRRRYDLDNVFKAVADALNGVCYVDDRQIVSGQFAIYEAGDNPQGVSVIISTVLSGERSAA